MSTRLRLGDGLNTWRPTRHQIGVGFAPGVNDTTPYGQLHFVVNRAKLRAVKRKHFNESGATLKANALPGLPNHYLMSDISVEDAVELFKTHGVPFDMEELPELQSGQTGKKGKKNF